MKYYIGSRGIKKTYKLLQYAKDNNCIIICENPNALRVKAENYGFIGLTFVSLDYQLKDNEAYVIDDLDNYLSYYNIKNFSLTIDE